MEIAQRVGAWGRLGVRLRPSENPGRLALARRWGCGSSGPVEKGAGGPDTPTPTMLLLLPLEVVSLWTPELTGASMGNSQSDHQQQEEGPVV